MITINKKLFVFLIASITIISSFVSMAIAAPLVQNIDADSNGEYLLLEWDKSNNKLFIYGDYRLIPEQGNSMDKRIALQFDKPVVSLQGAALEDGNGCYALINGVRHQRENAALITHFPAKAGGNSLDYHVQWTDRSADDEKFVVEYVDARTYIAAEYDAAVAKHIFSIWMTENGKRVGLSNYNQSIFRIQFDKAAQIVNDSLIVTASARTGDDLAAYTGYIISNRYFSQNRAEWQAVSRAQFSLAEPTLAESAPDVITDEQLGFDLAGDLTGLFTYAGELPNELSGKPVRLLLKYGVDLEHEWEAIVAGLNYSFSVPRSDFPAVGQLVVECNATGEPDGWLPLVRGELTASHLNPSIKFTIGDTAYVANGETKYLEAAPFIRDSSTLVPVRALEALGVNIGWAPATQTATFKLGGKMVKVTVGSMAAEVNGQRSAMPIAPELVNGRTMVPFRFIGESLGLKVHYAPASQEITITR